MHLVASTSGVNIRHSSAPAPPPPTMAANPGTGTDNLRASSCSARSCAASMTSPTLAAFRTGEGTGGDSPAATPLARFASGDFPMGGASPT